MNFTNFSLRVKGRTLIDNTNINFSPNVINHILGKNGVGKSCIAKAVSGILDYSGHIDIPAEDVTVISSYSNIPKDLKVSDIYYILSINCDSIFDSFLFKSLILDNISPNLFLKDLSDGQRQKIKILYFLSFKPKVVILDEVTNALDKSTVSQLYDFFNVYSRENDVVILNITHNLFDLDCMKGDYFLIENNQIKNFDLKEDVVDAYIRS